ncbi:MAG: HIT family hydrolase [Gemmataceae bacterium]
MRHLWAPWRLAYVAQPKPAEANDPCFICLALAADRDREHLVVHRSRLSVVLLNKFPYNNGHLLVAPKAHKPHPCALSAEEALDLHGVLCHMVQALEALLHPDGFNVGLNLGRAAGAGLPDHLHWHIVPRWSGDTNFMPVLADTKVIVQSLDALYDLLRQRLDQSSDAALPAEAQMRVETDSSARACRLARGLE